jgi:putative addiction module component (TIGR02574 family)
MGKHEIIDMALQLNAAERYDVVEKIMQSLDKSDAEIDRVWAEEALHRAKACDEGRMKTLSFEEVFGNK